MKERILTGWTFTRVLYVAIGIFIIVQAIMERQWLGGLLGGYFASMGLFAFGCASGSCFTGGRNTKSIQKNTMQTQEIEFEEIKIK